MKAFPVKVQSNEPSPAYRNLHERIEAILEFHNKIEIAQYASTAPATANIPSGVSATEIRCIIEELHNAGYKDSRIDEGQIIIE